MLLICISLISIFSCAYWPLICWPLYSDFPSSFAHFLLDYSFLIDLSKFIMYFGYKSLLKYLLLTFYILAIPVDPYLDFVSTCSSLSLVYLTQWWASASLTIQSLFGFIDPYFQLSNRWSKGSTPLNLVKLTLLFPLPNQLCLVYSLFLFMV